VPPIRFRRTALLWSTANSAAQAGGGAARHTLACTVDCPTTVADCRRLRFRRAPSKVLAVSRTRRSWAVSGPSEGARQWPRTTNGDHQAHGHTVSEQRKRRSPRSPARPRARRSRVCDHASRLRLRRGWEAFSRLEPLWDLSGAVVVTRAACVSSSTGTAGTCRTRGTASVVWGLRGAGGTGDTRRVKRCP
jgi:hypothetical protein